jgi:hypothetical protein
MSQMGHGHRFGDVRATAALPLEAEVMAASQQRREGPEPDVQSNRMPSDTTGTAPDGDGASEQADGPGCLIDALPNGFRFPAH